MLHTSIWLDFIFKFNVKQQLGLDMKAKSSKKKAIVYPKPLSPKVSCVRLDQP